MSDVWPQVMTDIAPLEGSGNMQLIVDATESGDVVVKVCAITGNLWVGVVDEGIPSFPPPSPGEGNYSGFYYLKEGVTQEFPVRGGETYSQFYVGSASTTTGTVYSYWARLLPE